jgi:hypothetical protein
MNDINKNLSKSEKLKALGISEQNQNQVSDRVLNLLYKNLIYTKWHEEKAILTRRQKLDVIGLNSDTSIDELTNEMLNQMYSKAIADIFAKDCLKDRCGKLKKLGLDPNFAEEELSDKALNELFGKIYKPPSKKITATKKAVGVKLPKNDPKYILALEFLNKILKVLNKEPIQDLNEFQKIKKDDLLKNECKEILISYLDVFAKNFGKTVLYYSYKNKPNYILYVIKPIITLCGYNFNSHTCQTSKTQPSGIIKKISWTEYSIN